MFEELKKRTFRRSLAWSIILIIAGLSLTIYSAPDAFYGVVGYKDFVQLAPDEIKPNQVVEIDLTTNFGCYLEEYEYNTETRVSRTTDYYYVIWTGDEYATDFRYMSIKVPASYERRMEDMAENTYNETLSDAIYFCGRIRQLDDEEYSYFEEYFLESGWTAQEIEDGTLPYYIDCYTSKGSMIGMFVILFAGGLALLIWGIVRIVNGIKGGFLKKLQKDITDAGYTESAIESDYNNAFSYGKKDAIKVGRLMTYFTLGSYIRAIPNNKILWAYQNTVTHRTNGVKTGTTYNVVIVVEGVKNAFTLVAPNEATSQEILQRMNAMFPWVVVGYSDQLKTMLRKNRDQFLALRYNTCEHVAVEPGFEEYNTASNE